MPSISFATLFIPEHGLSLFHSIHKMAYLLFLLDTTGRALQREQMTIQLYLQRVISTYLDALGYQEPLLWTFEIVWSQHYEAIHNGQALFHHMCRFSQPVAFWPQERFSRSRETGWTYHSHPSAALSYELWMQ